MFAFLQLYFQKFAYFFNCCPKVTNFDGFFRFSPTFTEQIDISYILKFPEILQQKLLNFSEIDFEKLYFFEMRKVRG